MFNIFMLFPLCQAVQPAMLPGGGNEWKVFLLMNPQLANGGLFLHYYSKQRMLLDPDSRYVCTILVMMYCLGTVLYH